MGNYTTCLYYMHAYVNNILLTLFLEKEKVDIKAARILSYDKLWFINGWFCW